MAPICTFFINSTEISRLYCCIFDFNAFSQKKSSSTGSNPFLVSANYFLVNRIHLFPSKINFLSKDTQSVFKHFNFLSTENISSQSLKQNHFFPKEGCRARFLEENNLCTRPLIGLSSQTKFQPQLRLIAWTNQGPSS